MPRMQGLQQSAYTAAVLWIQKDVERSLGGDLEKGLFTKALKIGETLQCIENM